MSFPEILHCASLEDMWTDVCNTLRHYRFSITTFANATATWALGMRAVNATFCHSWSTRSWKLLSRILASRTLAHTNRSDPMLIPCRSISHLPKATSYGA